MLHPDLIAIMMVDTRRLHGSVVRGYFAAFAQAPGQPDNAHSYQPVCIINTYYLTYPTPHTRDARLGRR